MSNVTFLWIFSRGIELGVIILCLLPLRALFRRKVPRLFSYILWAALPVDIGLNLVVKIISRDVSNVVHIHKMPKVSVEENIVHLMKWCWICGIIFVVLWMVISYVRFLYRLTGCIRLQKGIYLADRIKTPFTLGLLCPKIYLPVSLKKEYYEYVISHERVHISRKDVWMKYLAVGFLGLFWFQPLLWFACRLFLDDMEEACDETVIRKKDSEFRKKYAKALVEISFQAGNVHGAAVGYGNGTIKSRIRNIVNYKQVRLRDHLMAVMICVWFVLVSVLISWQVPRLVQKVDHVKGYHEEVQIWQIGTGKEIFMEEK